MLLSQELLTAALLVMVVWLVFISFFLYQAIERNKKLTAGSAKGDILSVVEKILKEQSLTQKTIEEIIRRVEGIETDNKSHIQKIGLIRFNPFSETGGDQSFTLAILNGAKSGIVISSLHNRESTRIYAKPVKTGKVEGYSLSKEEIQSIEKACKD
ncbi:MAG: DUF4446 family protein [bacterium]|nr:DUF4446 family protein [bacterium]